MYATAVRWMIRRNVQKVNNGDIGPMLCGYADDAVLVFPGEHSWGGEYRGKERIRQFLQRCVDSNIKFNIEEIAVDGWPWNTTICVRLSDEAKAPDGRVVYTNRAMIYGKIKWGKITFQEDYEDTQRVVAFDKYLESAEGKRATSDREAVAAGVKGR
jgi:ketosteroid isomerase-like protein